MWIVLMGSLNGGFEAFGPFSSHQAAIGYAESDGIVMSVKGATRAANDGECYEPGAWNFLTGEFSEQTS